MLSLRRFIAGGGGKGTIIEPTRIIDDTGAFVSIASVTYNSDGTLTLVGDTFTPSTTEWVANTPRAGIGAGYWIRWTYVSGTAAHWLLPGSMDLGTWYQLSTNQQGTFTSDIPGGTTSVHRADLAIDAAGVTIVDTTDWTVNLGVT